jgi:hypothetical protein
MTQTSGLALYDAGFYRWLDKRAARGAALQTQEPPLRPTISEKLDLTALLRREFEPKILARLNALGFAT